MFSECIPKCDPWFRGSRHKIMPWLRTTWLAFWWSLVKMGISSKKVPLWMQPA